jgi:tRNA pseudouridine38-40 synthase
MKLLIPLDSRDIFVHNVNSFLPSDIRVNGLTKVTKNFNSKLQCSRRRYHYLLPTYMLQEKSKILVYLNAAFVEQGPITNAGKEGGFAEPGSSKFLGPSGLTSVRNNLKSSRIDHEKILLLRNALKSYEGTKKFHNFTKDKHPSDSNATRYLFCVQGIKIITVIIPLFVIILMHNRNITSLSNAQ